MIYIGSDHAGFELKEHIKNFLRSQGIRFEDVGAFRYDANDDYPDYARKVVQGVLENENNRGIMICATGIGSCIAANKFSGIRAAVVYNEEIARLSREHNDSNVMCLGGKVTDKTYSEKLVKVWLETQFSREDRHIRRIKKIEVFELGN